MHGFLDRYYSLRGWTSNGAPTPEKLKELGLEKIVKVSFKGLGEG